MDWCRLDGANDGSPPRDKSHIINYKPNVVGDLRTHLCFMVALQLFLLLGGTSVEN